MELENKNIVIDINELSLFSFKKNNSLSLSNKLGFTISDSNNAVDSLNISSLSQQYESYIDSININVLLEKVIEYEKYNLIIKGESDIILFDGNHYITETIKSINKINGNVNPFSYPDFFARSILISYMFMEQNGVEEIEMKMSFISKENGKKVSFSSNMVKPYLSQLFDSLINRIKPICDRFYISHSPLLKQIENMPFPYSSIREGQETFIKEEYKAIQKKKNLVVSAPTGIGKTISALFPAIKSISTGAISKIFYFTSKTTTGNAAIDSIKLMEKYIPDFKVCSILAKDTVCQRNIKSSSRLISKCNSCDLIDRNKITSLNKSFQERQFEAVTELLSLDTFAYTKDIIAGVAEKHSVCPYELSLDISEYCQLIICDCNYVLDSNVRFKRYFKDNKNNDRFVFLFDEAHNIPDRTRNTYSVEISLSQIINVYDQLTNNNINNIDLISSLNNTKNEFALIKEQCKESEYFKNTENGEIHCGYYKSNAIPNSLLNSLKSLFKEIKNAKNSEDIENICSNLFEKLYKFNTISDFFDKRFIFFCEKIGDEITIKILCLDPSSVIKQMLSVASSSVFFSATMSPIEYYIDNFGLDNIYSLSLDSPYDHDNCCLITYDSISTRLSDRYNTAEDCAQVITETVSSNIGNYIVYFPSYDYMKKVCKLFSAIMPECGIVMQKNSMTYKEKQKFISIFKDKKYPSVVGFCVLGGMFSEGIDLSGESLIGTIIVGCGMPQLSVERNLMSTYYDEKCEKGYQYSYISPGINKVLQAAGRVIRSETDKGVVVIIDDRINDPQIRSFLPQHWNNMKFTGNLSSLKIILDDFWSNFD